MTFSSLCYDAVIILRWKQKLLYTVRPFAVSEAGASLSLDSLLMSHTEPVKVLLFGLPFVLNMD